MEVKRVPARGESVEVTLTFTAEEWKTIETNAHWDYRTVETYLHAAAIAGPPRRGC